MKKENIVRGKYNLNASCASNHAAEKYEFVFHLPRSPIECFSQNWIEKYNARWSTDKMYDKASKMQKYRWEIIKLLDM